MGVDGTNQVDASSPREDCYGLASEDNHHLFCPTDSLIWFLIGVFFFCLSPSHSLSWIHTLCFRLCHCPYLSLPPLSPFFPPNSLSSLPSVFRALIICPFLPIMPIHRFRFANMFSSACMIHNSSTQCQFLTFSVRSVRKEKKLMFGKLRG